MSRQWIDVWAASDEARELGDRVRWPLMWENEGAPRERYWHMVLVTVALAEPRIEVRPIVDVPIQLTLDAA